MALLAPPRHQRIIGGGHAQVDPPPGKMRADYDIILPPGFGPEVKKCLRDIRERARVVEICDFRVAAAGKSIGDVLKSKAKEARVRLAEGEMMRLAAACETLAPSGITIGAILKQKAKDARERLAERVIAQRDKLVDIELALQMADSFTFSNTRRPAGVHVIVAATKMLQGVYRKRLESKRSAILDNMLRPDADKPLLQENPWGFELKYDLFKPGSNQPVEHASLPSLIQKPVLDTAAKGGETSVPWEHQPLMKAKQPESQPVPIQKPVWRGASMGQFQSEQAKVYSGSVMPPRKAAPVQNNTKLEDDNSRAGIPDDGASRTAIQMETGDDEEGGSNASMHPKLQTDEQTKTYPGMCDGASHTAIRIETGDDDKGTSHGSMHPKGQTGRRKIQAESSEMMNSRRSLQQPQQHSKKGPAGERLPSLANAAGSSRSSSFSSSGPSATCPSSAADFGMMNVWSFGQSSTDGRVCIKKRQTDSISLDASMAMQQAVDKSGGHMLQRRRSFAGPRVHRPSTSHMATLLPRSNSYTSAGNPTIIASPYMPPLLPRSSSSASSGKHAIAQPYPSAATSPPTAVDRACTAWQAPGSTFMRHDDLLQSNIPSESREQQATGQMRCISLASVQSAAAGTSGGRFDALRVPPTPPLLLHQRRRQSDTAALLRMHNAPSTTMLPQTSTTVPSSELRGVIH